MKTSKDHSPDAMTRQNWIRRIDLKSLWIDPVLIQPFRDALPSNRKIRATAVSVALAWFVLCALLPEPPLNLLMPLGVPLDAVVLLVLEGFALMVVIFGLLNMAGFVHSAGFRAGVVLALLMTVIFVSLVIHTGTLPIKAIIAGVSSIPSFLADHVSWTYITFIFYIVLFAAALAGVKIMIGYSVKQLRAVKKVTTQLHLLYDPDLDGPPSYV